MLGQQKVLQTRGTLQRASKENYLDYIICAKVNLLYLFPPLPFSKILGILRMEDPCKSTCNSSYISFRYLCRMLCDAVIQLSTFMYS